MSNKATKTFFIVFSIVFVVGIVLFIIASNSGEAKTDQPKKEVDTSNIEVLVTPYSSPLLCRLVSTVLPSHQGEGLGAGSVFCPGY